MRLRWRVYPAFALATGPLSPGKVGRPYSARLRSIGGKPSVMWRVTAGRLPAGLRLTSTGAISGSPTKSGSFGITVSAKDGLGRVAKKQVTITVR